MSAGFIQTAAKAYPHSPQLPTAQPPHGANMNNPFTNLGLSAEITAALADQGYGQPTAIQTAAIPKVLAGHDLLAAAQTGTGKTAAFMLPSLERLRRCATPCCLAV